MRKRIISVGFSIPGHSDCYHSYNSSQSLLDADIVVFEPDFSCYRKYSTYQGKKCFDENTSFLLKENTDHWHSEISTALWDGKTVFVFMGQYNEVFVHTGEKKFSGTGKNTQITDMVSGYNNYEFLSIDIPPLIPKGGSEIVFAGNGLFVTFWSEFKKYIKYECYIDGGIKTPLFLTKTGRKPVGGLFRHGKGNLVLLPPIRYPQEEFTEYNEEDGEEYWTEEAIGFGKLLVQSFLDVDSELRSSAEASSPPGWAREDEYRLKSETELTNKISTISEKIEELKEQKNTISKTLREEEKLKGLLFEKGKPLENAVIEALKILEYKAENYDDGNLELDQVVVGPNGERYIGETEGKDNSAINIDKFRQLESNIGEDLQRDDVNDPAVGILFGNGFRITHPEKRAEQFTEKCVKNAERVNAILVRTSDLFKVAKHVRENNDKKFAEKCRKTISRSRGKIVKFPET